MAANFRIHVLILFLLAALPLRAGALSGGSAAGARAGSIRGGSGAVNGITSVAGMASGGYVQPFWFQTPFEPFTRLRTTGMTSGTVAVGDLFYSQGTALSVSDVIWPYIVQLDRISPSAITRTSSDNSVITPSAYDSGVWLYQASGTATITLSCTNLTISRSVAVTSSTVAGARTFIGMDHSSAAYSAIAPIDNLIASANPATQKAIYSSANDSTGVYVRNPLCWASSFDLGCVAVWNTYGGGSQQRGATLISPLHIAMAAHYSIAPGSDIRFVTMSGSTVTRRLLATAFVGVDLTVGILDSPVTGITPAKVLGSNNAGHLPIPMNTLGVVGDWLVPVLYFNQFRQAEVGEGLCYSSGMMTVGLYPTVAARRNFCDGVVSGDSGAPAFLVFGNQLVLVTVWHHVGGGTDLRDLTAQTNTVMHSLSVNVGASSDYQLTPVDLSGYPSY